MKNKIWKIEFDLDWGTRYPRRIIEFFIEGKGNKKPDFKIIYCYFLKIAKSIDRSRKKNDRPTLNVYGYDIESIKKRLTVSEVKINSIDGKSHSNIISKHN